MKQYLMSVILVDGKPTPSEEDMQQMYQDVDAVNRQLTDAGALVFAGGLHPVSSASTVRLQNGDPVVTDGPFAESKEQLGGFWIIKAADLDEALDWGRKAAVACRDTVEVRPFEDDPDQSQQQA